VPADAIIQDINKTDKRINPDIYTPADQASFVWDV
jgi:hypothetical protein